MNKIPAMLNEVSKDFGISKKKIIETMSETEYILPLTAVDYVDRLSKQLNLPDLVVRQAKNLIQNGNGRGTSPTIIAALCCYRSGRTDRILNNERDDRVSTRRKRCRCKNGVKETDAKACQYRMISTISMKEFILIAF